jgi:hypothetical protein
MLSACSCRVTVWLSVPVLQPLAQVDVTLDGMDAELMVLPE